MEVLVTAATGPTPKQSTPFNQLSSARQQELVSRSREALTIKVMTELASLNLTSPYVSDAEKQKSVANLINTLVTAKNEFSKLQQQQKIDLINVAKSLKETIHVKNAEMYQAITDAPLAAKLNVKFDVILVHMIYNSIYL